MHSWSPTDDVGLPIKISPLQISKPSAEASVLKREAAVLCNSAPSLEDKSNVSNTPISCTIRELRAHHQHTEERLFQFVSSLFQEYQVCFKTWPPAWYGDGKDVIWQHTDLHGLYPRTEMEKFNTVSITGCFNPWSNPLQSALIPTQLHTSIQRSRSWCYILLDHVDF